MAKVDELHSKLDKTAAALRQGAEEDHKMRNELAITRRCTFITARTHLLGTLH